ncbi:hypothetical protein F5Y15DRAFT_378514 [Xylariaceae sp. FL0016]|nr:hypothetical protein F5Y15DRAFT_378514 [Xylariaceae sp. FL0016]
MPKRSEGRTRRPGRSVAPSRSGKHIPTADDIDDDANEYCPYNENPDGSSQYASAHVSSASAEPRGYAPTTYTTDEDTMDFDEQDEDDILQKHPISAEPLPSHVITAIKCIICEALVPVQFFPLAEQEVRRDPVCRKHKTHRARDGRLQQWCFGCIQYQDIDLFTHKTDKKCNLHSQQAPVTVGLQGPARGIDMNTFTSDPRNPQLALRSCDIPIGIAPNSPGLASYAPLGHDQRTGGYDHGQCDSVENTDVAFKDDESSDPEDEADNDGGGYSPAANLKDRACAWCGEHGNPVRSVEVEDGTAWRWCVVCGRYRERDGDFRDRV